MCIYARKSLLHRYSSINKLTFYQPCLFALGAQGQEWPTWIKEWFCQRKLCPHWENQSIHNTHVAMLVNLLDPPVWFKDGRVKIQTTGLEKYLV